MNSMARTRQKKGPKARRWSDAGKTVHHLSNSRKKRAAKNRLTYKLLRALGVLLACTLVAVVGFGFGAYFGLMQSVGEPKEPEVNATAPTYIYSQPLGDTEGSRRVIGTIFHGENRKTATLEEMPPNLLNALVAKEDERFREHAGVDLWGIMRRSTSTSGRAKPSKVPALSPNSTSETPTLRRIARSSASSKKRP